MEYSIPDISTISGTDTPGIAKKLLNKIIISKTENTLLAARIVETEAYKAPEDKASHAYNNLLTDRTRVMYGPPGRAYIYLCYGIHNMLNIVTGPEGLAHAVLIRALEPIKGHEVFHRRRPVKNPKNMMNGPGKLCQAFDINRDMNNIDLFKKESVLHLGDAPEPS